jgi:hypothetical protein
MNADDEPDLLSWGWEQCRCRIEGADFERVEGIQVTGVYHGVLFWRCTICGRSFQRWPAGDGRHGWAQPFIDVCNRADEEIARLVGPGVFIRLSGDLYLLDECDDQQEAETLGDAIRRLAYEELLSADEDHDGEE